MPPKPPPIQTENNEASPLIGAHHQDDPEGEPDQDVSQHGLDSLSPSSAGTPTLALEDSFVESKSTWYLILLTLSIGGLQIVWSIELSNGSPYLLSLGMSKALVAFVWLAGPATGVLVQPYVGMLSDRCRISWGKRKPFMIAGTLGTIISSLILAYSKQIVAVIGRYSFEDDVYHGWWRGITITIATIMMWCLDFSINTVQAAIRAFIVDGAPAHQQESANAWASRIVGVGNVLGYIFGYLNLPRYFSFLGREQFQALCALASIILSTTVGISALTVPERNPQLEPPNKQDHNTGMFTFFKNVYSSIRRLPEPIYAVCKIQFFNWMGWFPFLFYITTYIGQLYVDPSLTPNLPPAEVEALWARATRIGTFALLIYAIVSLATNVFAPFLIVPTYTAQSSGPVPSNTPGMAPTSPIGTRARAQSYSETQHSLHSLKSSHHSTQRPSILTRVLHRLRIPGLTLRRAWLLGQLLFSVCMFSTILIPTYQIAIVMVSVVGVSWSMSLWAPFALISAEISKRDEARRQRSKRKLMAGDSGDYFEGDDQEEARAGIILGLHNVAVSAPQVVATLVCSAIFKWLQKPRNVPGDVSVAWCLRLGGIAGLVSAYFTWRMKESGSGGEEEQTYDSIPAGGH